MPTLQLRCHYACDIQWITGTQIEDQLMANRITPQEVLKALAGVKDATTGRDIASSGQVRDIEVGDRYVSFTLFPANPSSPTNEQLVNKAKQAVEALGSGEVRIRLAAAPTQAGSSGASLIPQVKHTVAIASGKGGVGKSTVAANLAVALHRLGNRVGLMDTDVYGPSAPILMGGQEEPKVIEGKIQPPVEYGVKMISMAYFLPKDEAVIWRGPMLHKTIHQFLGDVRWGELDYLVMDLPPGTGDIQLSLSQTIPLSGAVIVSTPQDLALTVASKAIAMFRKLNVPILGLIENMSYHVCAQCGYREDIFGHGGAQQAARQMGYAFLGEIPLDISIRLKSDSGEPVALDDSAPQGKAFRDVAAALVGEVRRAQDELATQEISIE
jgi:ATP-binding protein involved in chromosome partitioning